MVRAVISFDDKELKRIDALARKTKRSRAQVIREVMSQHLKKEDVQPTWKELVSQTAGMWKHKNIDGVEYQRKLRAEWDR